MFLFKYIRYKELIKYKLVIFMALILFFALFFSFYFNLFNFVQASSGGGGGGGGGTPSPVWTDITGYAFFDSNNPYDPSELGNVSMSCKNDSSCGSQNYGVQVDIRTKDSGGTGAIKGKAWSDVFGWISFDQADLVGCPISSCNAYIDWGSGKVLGWAKILEDPPGMAKVYENKFISLNYDTYNNSGAMFPYGVTVDPSTGFMNGSAFALGRVDQWKYSTGYTNGSISWLNFENVIVDINNAPGSGLPFGCYLPDRYGRKIINFDGKNIGNDTLGEERTSIKAISIDDGIIPENHYEVIVSLYDNTHPDAPDEPNERAILKTKTSTGDIFSGISQDLSTTPPIENYLIQGNSILADDNYYIPEDITEADKLEALYPTSIDPAPFDSSVIPACFALDYTCPFAPQPDRIIIRFVDDKGEPYYGTSSDPLEGAHVSRDDIVDGVITFGDTLNDFEFIDPAVYDITLASYDDHSAQEASSPGSADEPDEIWRLRLYEDSDGSGNYVETSAIQDLPTNKDYIIQKTDTSLPINQFSRSAGIYWDGTDTSKPNGVKAVCAALDKVDRITTIGSCPFEDKPGRTIFEINGVGTPLARLVADYNTSLNTQIELTDRVTSKDGSPLLPGDYFVQMASYDDDDHEQNGESWHAVLYNSSGVEIGQTDDTPDLEARGITETYLIHGPTNRLTISDVVTEVAGRHAKWNEATGSDSVEPVCIAFDLVGQCLDGSNPTDIFYPDVSFGDAKTQDETLFVNGPDDVFGSSFYKAQTKINFPACEEIKSATVDINYQDPSPPRPVFIFVFDRSGSMRWSIDPDNPNAYGPDAKINVLKNTVNTTLPQLFNAFPDAKVKFISFANTVTVETNGYPGCVDGFCDQDDLSTLNSITNNININEDSDGDGVNDNGDIWTNIQGSYETARDEFNYPSISDRENRYIIHMTDGIPQTNHGSMQDPSSIDVLTDSIKSTGVKIYSILFVEGGSVNTNNVYNLNTRYGFEWSSEREENTGCPGEPIPPITFIPDGSGGYNWDYNGGDAPLGKWPLCGDVNNKYTYNYNLDGEDLTNIYESILNQISSKAGFAFVKDRTGKLLYPNEIFYTGNTTGYLLPTGGDICDNANESQVTLDVFVQEASTVELSNIQASICLPDICGDGIVSPTEQCDPGANVDLNCPYGATSCQVCNASCELVPGTTSYCGDGVIDTSNGELCEGSDLGGATCESLAGYSGGTLSCNNSNCRYDTTQCISATQCSDNVDNDGDGLIDAQDPACWTDPEDPGTYDPDRPSEGSCGDNICEPRAGETPLVCPLDCVVTDVEEN